MGVYVKGMKMPEICDMCPLLAFIEKGKDHDAFCYCSLSNWKKSCTPDPMTIREARRFRRLDCPLVEVPPHGRLIDADAFSAKIMEIIEAQSYDDFYTQSISVGEILREVVHELRGMGLNGYANAPTIISANPAEKEDT